MWDKGQPVRFVQFAPATEVGITRHEEIDGPFKFMAPVSAGRDSTLLRIDVNNRASRDHRELGIRC
jgi:hypothetical protein